MQGTQILIPVDIEAFWQQLRLVVEEVLEHRKIGKAIGGDNGSKLLKAKEVCELLQVSKPTIYDWMRKGQLKSVKIESRRFFLASDIEELIRNSRSNNGMQEDG